MRHAAPRKASRIGTTFRTAAVSALAFGGLAVAARAQAHAATSASHTATDDDSVLAAVRVLKTKTVALAHAPKG
ncbi:hypothetical protein [Streptomyces sp. MBT62]|uniref:hypothetical protein n=1 Tax=Streptomyces sp. MBT62 TaxID=2800410 RepID=UPI00190AB907|nr:hypothetical protein [Streptomyces sp. MBT62]MBK3567978.1 hypothetical protein [Streptomyces sp. MBT62]